MTDELTMKTTLMEIGKSAKAASAILANTPAAVKNQWLLAMADALDSSHEMILAANAEDMEQGRKKGMSGAMLDRLLLTPERIKGISDALRYVTTLEDPVGHVLSSVERPNGIQINKVSVPIGVIGFIFESRPNVTVDAAGLCLKSGNAVILRGGSEAFRSNMTLAKCIADAGIAAGMPAGAVQLIPFTDHAAVSMMLKMDSFINLIIPRGGERLIRTVVEQSTIPVIKHYKGVCHVYVDKTADFDTALKIIENGKCQRPGVCNAVETVLIHEAIARDFVPAFAALMKEKGVELRASQEILAIEPGLNAATEDDWSAEYLSLILAVKTVASVQDAVSHINQYGSGHSDAIVAADPEALEYFLNYVDSAAVYANASTRFTDGGEFGMGAEIGISTDKLHARGPMGLQELTTYKYKILGSGQTR
ncbi:MAG: glutamate-5-semialdehyde dehydrogenase [Lentisphaeria bacterium]|nr:glutamate-5-semialdehyde dehydrogenase [Lentisphaeria bacterium]